MYRNDEPPPEPPYDDTEEAVPTRLYKVVWDNGHASGTLALTFDTEEAATAYAEDWYAEMVALDPDPEEAARVYEYEVIEVDEAEDA